MMNLGLSDLHMLLDAGARKLKLFSARHELVFECEARNRTVANGQLGHNGNCPPGSYMLGNPSPRGTVPFGDWFVPILDYDANHTLREHRRSGIGIHGGGSGLPFPFHAFQGWQVTRGCWRLQNMDLARLVTLLERCSEDGGVCYVTVTAAAPGAVEADGDDTAGVVLAEGE
jgi:hypothetical protein